MYSRLQAAAIPLKVRAVISTVTIAFVASNTAAAQQTSETSPWIIGTAFGITSDPPIAFFEGPYTAPTNGPYDYSGCWPGAFASFGFLAGRRLNAWLRSDVVLAAHADANACQQSFTDDRDPASYVWIEYRGRTPGYLHSTLVARAVVEKQDAEGISPRMIAGVGCICEKRIPLAQLGLGLSAGNARTRVSLEAGGQFSRFTWTRVIMPDYRPPQPLIVIKSESGTSTPRQYWLRIGVEYIPGVEQ
jgi:hypothetical protein